MPLGNAMSGLVIMEFEKGGVTIKAEDIDFSKSASETLICDYDEEEKFTIGFKGASLMDAIKNVEDETLVMEFTEPNKPCVVYANATSTKEEYLVLVMPMLVD
jgi:DNA polymerase-3 subunit beta